MAAHLKMTYKKGHLMVMWVSRHPHTLSFLEGERMRSISVYRNTQPFRWLQWELGAALVSELLITHIWKPLHRFSMERSGLEEADSNKLATFSKKKKPYLTAQNQRCSLVCCARTAQKHSTQTGNGSTETI